MFPSIIYSDKQMKQKIKLLTRESFLEKLFLLSLFLIKLPSIYIFFPIRSALLTTHSIARIVVLVLFVVIVVKQFLGKKAPFTKKGKLLFGIFLVYLAFQSISVFPAISLGSFLYRYKDVVFPGLFLFVALGLPKARKKIIFVFLLTTAISFFYQMFIFWATGLFQSLAKVFIYEPHFELVEINIQRARIFVETYDEIVVPFLFVLAMKYKKPKQRILILLGFLLIASTTLFSNFRTRMLMLAFAFLASFILFLGRKILIRAGFLFSLVVVVYFTAIILNEIFGFSFIDRLTFQNKREDVGTILVRSKNLDKATEIGLAFPFTGAGLGNYEDYLSGRNMNGKSQFSWIDRESEIASTNPHNIFAQVVSETGIISLLFYVGVLGYFAKEDSRIIFGKQKDQYAKAFIISFWTLFIYALFNPTTTLPYNSLFWILRAMI